MNIEINKLVKDSSKIKSVNAIVLFGSQATGKNNKNSDIDLCFFGKIKDEDKLNIQRMFPEKYDISFFNELPIWIKTRVFKEGKILFLKNKEEYMDVVFKTMHEWEDFKPIIQNRVYGRFGKCMT